MTDQRKAIDDLAGLMDEFSLDEARLKVGDISVSFARTRSLQTASPEHFDDLDASEVVALPLTGTPISSPMTGIFYARPSPDAPPYAPPGSEVTAGQVVGLIEAMKVFNEIVSTVSGTVDRTVAENGAVVNPGDILIMLK